MQTLIHIDFELFIFPYARLGGYRLPRPRPATPFIMLPLGTIHIYKFLMDFFFGPSPVCRS